jgi:L-ascorbate metabolism protein UlaG (beta-lactamase superfamily)
VSLGNQLYRVLRDGTSMKLTWLAHACFLIEGSGLRIITDPYTPDILGYPPVTEKADLVIRSSDDDLGHCRADLIPGAPQVVTATSAVETAVMAMGITIQAIAVKESLVHKVAPIDNAMYRFSLDGVTVAHFGDVGNALTPDQIAGLDAVDVVLVPTGGPPTLDLSDLVDALRVIKPRIVIPMHYSLPGCKPQMLPAKDFTALYPPELVEWADSSSLDVYPNSTPKSMKIIVLMSKLTQEFRPT